MIVKEKNRDRMCFNQMNVGTVFRDDDCMYMKIRIADDNLSCPRCDEDIHISDEIVGFAVDIETGTVYQLNEWDSYELVNGAFIEE